jgi:ABC-type spermidine/putrescine transport system permease subunit II
VLSDDLRRSTSLTVALLATTIAVVLGVVLG